MTRTWTIRTFSCVLLLATVSTVAASLVTPDAAVWRRAQQGYAALEAIPEARRTRSDYKHSLDLFRAVYRDTPAALHAPAAILAEANLLAEQGRVLHDAHSLQAAAGDFHFLRTQYPMSSLVSVALLAEARLEQEDLHDAAAARERYMLLIKTHPKTPQAEQARAALGGLHDTAQRSPSSKPAEQASTLADPGGSSSRASRLPAMATTATANGASDTLPANASPRQTDLPTALPAPVPTSVSADHRKDAIVSGIRHWSTNDYTRVAIDLGDEVTYEAARVPGPDRIYFDLHNTRLATELVGKSFAVTDDGFLRRIRAAQAAPGITRVVLDVSDVTEYSAFLLPNPSRLIIDIHGRGKAAGAAAGEDAGAAATPQFSGRAADRIPSAPEEKPIQAPAPRVAQTQPATSARPVPNTVAVKAPDTASEVAAVSKQPGKVEATAKPTTHPIAMTSIFGGGVVKAEGDSTRKRRKGKADAQGDAVALARPAVPTAAGETSMVRALGLKIGRIVIDAGHGGHDCGTLGAGGIQEKDVVLDVALRLGKLLHERLGAEIIYTRSDDTFIPLETRTAIANKAQADLFLSIHANSSPDESARGVETYYLNFTSQADALQVAARENAVSGSSIHELSDLVKKIALKDKIEESREFAVDVEQSLYGGLAPGNDGLKDRGVKKAPFVVLIGANMPSILAEISFVTNERDAAELRRPEYRQRVAESLFKGVAKYEAGLGENSGAIEQARR